MIAGLVQTGSVFLQAKPEKYRCRNYLDIKYDNFNYSKYEFASAESCKNWNFDWSENCVDGEEEECFDLFKGNLTCNSCEEYIYSDENTFRLTAVSQAGFQNYTKRYPFSHFWNLCIENFSKFNWICDTAVIPASSISTAIFMCGLFFGAMGLGNLSDAIGRRKGEVNTNHSKFTICIAFALRLNLRLLFFLILKLFKSDDDQRYWKHMC